MLPHVDTALDQSLSGIRRTTAEFLLTELELGFTFLDVAAATRESAAAGRCLRHAISALHTTNRILARAGCDELYDLSIHERRDQLAARLRKLLG